MLQASWHRALRHLQGRVLAALQVQDKSVEIHKPAVGDIGTSKRDLPISRLTVALVWQALLDVRCVGCPRPKSVIHHGELLLAQKSIDVGIMRSKQPNHAPNENPATQATDLNATKILPNNDVN